MTVPHPNPNGYGPLGTPNAGRDERIARREREDARRCRAAFFAVGNDDREGAELRRLRQQVCSLKDWLGDGRRELAQLRAELPVRIEAEVQRILETDLPEAIDYLLAHREVSRNGTATQNPHR